MRKITGLFLIVLTFILLLLNPVIGQVTAVPSWIDSKNHHTAFRSLHISCLDSLAQGYSLEASYLLKIRKEPLQNFQDGFRPSYQQIIPEERIIFLLLSCTLQLKGDCWYFIWSTVKPDQNELRHQLKGIGADRLGKFCEIMHCDSNLLGEYASEFLDVTVKPISSDRGTTDFTDVYIEPDNRFSKLRAPQCVYGYGIAYAINHQLQPNSLKTISLDSYFNTMYQQLAPKDRPYLAVLILTDPNYDGRREVKLKAQLRADRASIISLISKLSDCEIKDWCRRENGTFDMFQRNLRGLL